MRFDLTQKKISLDRLAPRKPRPLGRGQGELYKNVYFPYREAPPFRAGRLHSLKAINDQQPLHWDDLQQPGKKRPRTGKAVQGLLGLGWVLI
ncbi:MAG: hypothetical protein DRH17_05090 [Deltaproteobacteria bacterium]|nr:MAG: hypothetical protein DRH17_05090 [Deltaproteobacteria bacterium]